MGDLAGDQVKRDTSFRYGLAVGALLYSWTDSFGIQIELDYVQKGTRYDVTTSDGLPDAGTTTLKFNYLEVPILVMLGFDAGDDMRVFGTAGLALSFLTGAEIEIDYKNTATYNDDLWDSTAGFDMGIILGAGVLWGGLGVELRYDWGLLTTDSQPYGGHVMNEERYNRSLTLLGSARF